MDGFLPPSGLFRCWASCDERFLLRGQIVAVFSMESGGLIVLIMKWPVVRTLRVAAIKKGWKNLFAADASSLSSLAVRIILRGLLPPL